MSEINTNLTKVNKGREYRNSDISIERQGTNNYMKK